MKNSRFLCVLLPIFVLSCADTGGPVLVDAEWNLSCPSSGDVSCASWAQETCIGDGGHRAIVGEHGESACDDRIIAICESIERASGMRDITLEANVERGGGSSPKFAFELSVMVDSSDDSVELCNVTIIEGGVSYDFGACGQEPPSIAQPCQLSNISTEGEVVFDLECDSLVNGTTGFGVHVGALGGGPTTIRFANCTGF
jgi:hypothetical protein